jgi:hypothetical protein
MMKKNFLSRGILKTPGQKHLLFGTEGKGKS